MHDASISPLTLPQADSAPGLLLPSPSPSGFLLVHPYGHKVSTRHGLTHYGAGRSHVMSEMMDQRLCSAIWPKQFCPCSCQQLHPGHGSNFSTPHCPPPFSAGSFLRTVQHQENTGKGQFSFSNRIYIDLERPNIGVPSI
jgi:hypothetical protein